MKIAQKVSTKFTRYSECWTLAQWENQIFWVLYMGLTVLTSDIIENFKIKMTSLVSKVHHALSLQHDGSKSSLPEVIDDRR